MPASTQRFVGRGDGEENVAIHPARLLQRHKGGRVEAAHLAGYPHRKLAGVERLDEADAATSGDCGLPGRGGIEADRGDGSEPCDDDAPHEAQSVDD